MTIEYYEPEEIKYMLLNKIYHLNRDLNGWSHELDKDIKRSEIIKNLAIAANALVPKPEVPQP